MLCCKIKNIMFIRLFLFLQQSMMTKCKIDIEDNKFFQNKYNVSQL
jgi:hypothetical protein